MCDLSIGYNNAHKIEILSMGRDCGIEQKEELIAVRQGCSAHIAITSTKTSDAENKQDNFLKGK
jgi:hypothetical protein